MRFAIVGAGATGGFLGARLAAAGEPVTLIARGPTLEALRSGGVRVLEPDGSTLEARPDCTDDWGAIAEADCAFVTVKAHSLPDLAPRLGAAAGPGTTLVFAQNGIPWWYFLDAEEPRPRLESVDPGGAIAAAIPAASAAGCVVYAATSVVEPGLIRHEEGDRFTLAEIDGSRSERLRAISAALARARLKAPVSSRVRPEIWLKLLGNATLNPVSALTRATLAELLREPGSRDLVRTLMLEVEAVAGGLGVELELSVERRLAGAETVGEHRTSMLQDVEAGRPLEVEALLGAVVELGVRLGVPTPNLAAVYQLVRALDRSLAARRRYPLASAS